MREQQTDPLTSFKKVALTKIDFIDANWHVFGDVMFLMFIYPLLRCRITGLMKLSLIFCLFGPYVGVVSFYGFLISVRLTD